MVNRVSHNFKEDICGKFSVKKTCKFEILAIFRLMCLKIGNGNSDGRTGRLVWKCVSDHFLTTVRVWFYFICKERVRTGVLFGTEGGG